tara:strand:- start:1397 stop:2029 length:633 start_codon:yes stop_codon:yes gene_type:complete
MYYKFISIEGNIGVGKTTLAKRLSLDFKSRLLLEQFANNPFLPKFYKNPKEYAFPLELFFMAERYSQLKKHKEQDLFQPITIADYFFIKSKLFSDTNLGPDEKRLFNRLFEIMFSSLSNPDLVVYLYSNIDRLQKNIQKRGRVFEKEISNEYLQNIQEKYLDFLNKQNMFPVLILDVSEVDFIENKRVYQKIKSLISSKYDIGVHRFNLS